MNKVSKRCRRNNVVSDYLISTPALSRMQNRINEAGWPDMYSKLVSNQSIGRWEDDDNSLR